jgi:hypothetical protein
VLMYHIFTSSVGRFWVFRTVTISFLSFSCPYVYSRSLTISLVVCNLCYDNFLVAVLCNSLSFNEKRAIFSNHEKIKNTSIRVI